MEWGRMEAKAPTYIPLPATATAIPTNISLLSKLPSLDRVAFLRRPLQHILPLCAPEAYNGGMAPAGHAGSKHMHGARRQLQVGMSYVQISSVSAFHPFIMLHYFYFKY